jgi:acetyltransferase-like isoleucine patch superfamily enzyme
MIQSFILKIKRRETPFYAFLYKLIKGFFTFRIPVIRPVHLGLYYIVRFLTRLYFQLKRVFYAEPVFRARCHSVGKRLQLIGGVPYIEGNIKITIGDDCLVYGKTTLTSTRVYDEPELIVGDHSCITFMTTISVGQRVEIGNHVLMAFRCFIADNDGHPFDAVERRTQPVSKEQIAPVKIEDDCWLGANVVVLKGVTLGQGVIIGANSVVTRSIPPFCIAAGIPAKVIKELPIPEELSHLRQRRDRELGRETTEVV